MASTSKGKKRAGTPVDRSKKRGRIAYDSRQQPEPAGGNGGNVSERTSAPAVQSTLLESAITASGVMNEGVRNLNLSQNALAYIRKELYNREKGDKSFNKLRLDPAKRQDEIQRIQRATAAIDSIRSINVLKGDDASEYSNKIWKLSGQSCDTLSHIAEDRIKSQDPSAVVGKLGFSGMHTVAIIGSVPADTIKRGFEHWPEHLAICDPWANIACLVKDYPREFMSKMSKWESDNKAVVLNDATPLSPLDSRWTKLLTAARYVFERQQADDGKVSYKLIGASPTDAASSSSS